MRQIATLPDDPTARAFADYLLTLQIATRLMPDGDRVGVWVCDEDQLARAKQEVAAFEAEPTHPRYAAAGDQARKLRKSQERVEQAYERKQRHLDAGMAGGYARGRAVTLLLFAVCVGVALLTHLGEATESPVLQALSINHYDRYDSQHIKFHPDLADVRAGQVWRLVTPIFLHFGPVHLVLNMLGLLTLGGRVEASRGWWKYLLLVVAIAVPSNVAEYYCTFTLAETPWFRLDQGPSFGGISGVLYGLFGYAWVKSKCAPELGLQVSREDVVVGLGWLVMCLFGLFGPIANVAHFVGLAAGAAIGYAPHLRRRR